MTLSSDRLPLLLGACLGLLGVILGAFAAHFLKARLIANGTSEAWQIALFYQWVHALALLALGASGAVRRGPVFCWLLGVLFFSGSLYLLALDPALRWAGPVTPLGGLMLIVGWIWFIVHLLRRNA
jgi:uncharacterized membrane protein YgdD (TMEM256/DUF423 family)